MCKAPNPVQPVFKLQGDDMNGQKCKHKWDANGGKGGKAEFMKTSVFNDPVTHATCKECGARTFFTEQQWNSLGNRHAVFT